MTMIFRALIICTTFLLLCKLFQDTTGWSDTGIVKPLHMSPCWKQNLSFSIRLFYTLTRLLRSSFSAGPIQGEPKNMTLDFRLLLCDKYSTSSRTTVQTEYVWSTSWSVCLELVVSDILRNPDIIEQRRL